MNLSTIFMLYPQIGEHILFQLDLRSIINSSLVCISFHSIIVSPSFMFRILKLFRFENEIIKQWKHISRNSNNATDSITLALNMRKHLFFILKHTSNDDMSRFAKSCSVMTILFKNKSKKLLKIVQQCNNDALEIQYLAVLLNDLELKDDENHDLRQYDIERYTELWPPYDTFP